MPLAKLKPPLDPSLDHIPGLGSILRASSSTPPAKVRGALLLMGDRTIRDMAMDLRRRADHLSQVLNIGSSYSKAGQREIAQYLGVDVSDIWSPEQELNPACQPARAAGQ